MSIEVPATDAAAKYLSARSHTEKEVMNHLRGKGYTEGDIQEALGTLREYGYINDRDYCRQYLDYACGKGKGISYIRGELFKRGVSVEDIEISLEDYSFDETERERAYNQAEKFMAGKGKIDDKLLGKLGRRLSSMGYETDIVYSILGEYMRSGGEDNE